MNNDNFTPPEKPKKFTIRDAKKALGQDYTEAEYKAKLKKAKRTPVKDVLKNLGITQEEP